MFKEVRLNEYTVE